MSLKWPDWLDKVLAKSAELGANGKEESLAQHTLTVMERLSEFMKLRPNLPQELGVPRLWHILFWAAFLHDFGKAATGFQDRLYKKGPRWPHRHEVFSLAFVDWVAQDLSEIEQKWLVAAIVSHHKDCSRIKGTYNRQAKEQVEDVIGRFDETVLRGLWQWLRECPASWRDHLGAETFNIATLSVMPEEEAISLVQQNGTKRIFHWLRIYNRFVTEELEDSTDQALISGTILLRGYLINADHCASSHNGPLWHITLTKEGILQNRNNPIPWGKLFEHQKLAARFVGSALLTAPTGSGKTEAALLWVACQILLSGNSPRVFYTLPYQASMNAMKLRLDETFGEKNIALQHGRAALARYRMELDKADDDADPHKVAAQIKIVQDMAKLNYPPVRVFSPYQMLKGPYRLRGYEKLMSDYHHGLFIFDEIHAYEASRLALILETIKYLHLNYQAKFLVMSATFPDMIKNKLYDALGITNAAEIQAADKLYELPEFQRHRLQMREGQLLDHLDEIAEMAKSGQSVLVVCNRVAVAQEAFDTLAENLPESFNIEMLHGKFNMRDRARLEEDIRNAISADNDNAAPFVLVSTQAVEVSLDVDFDIIYTEPAPLDALIQRFGRVNRRGKKGIADVHVFLDCEWKRQRYVYDTGLVEATLAILIRESLRDPQINERDVGDWLDEIYSGEAAEQWETDYQVAAKEFRDVWLNGLRAFEAITSRTEQKFYELFDGTEVLPRCLVDEYEDFIAQKQYLDAYALLVPMQFGQLKSIHPHRATPDHFDKNWPVVVDLPYSSKHGLDMSEAREEPERLIISA